MLSEANASWYVSKKIRAENSLAIGIILLHDATEKLRPD